VVAESFSQTGGDPYPVVAHEQTVAAVSDSSQDEGGQGSNVAHDKIAVLIPEIKETHRRRQAFHRAEKSLTLQIKAIERRLLGVTALTSPEKKLLPAASPELSPSPANKRPSSSVGMPAPDSTLQDQQTASQSVPPIYQMQSAGPFLQESLSAFRKVPAHTALRSEDSIDSTSPDAIHELDTEDQTRPAASPEMEEVILFATLPLIEARESIKKHRLKAERLCAKLAEQLPVYKTFIEPVVGLGALGLAQIIGECGDLRNYANPAKLWKRMGLAVIDGKAHKRVKGEQTGYSPERRAVIFRIADSLLRQQNAFKELYVTRKVFEQQKVPEGPKMLWHRRSQRYVQKRLLRDLWRAWRVS
jgi:hypothetical protein